MFLKGIILKFTCEKQRPGRAKKTVKRNNELRQSDCGPEGGRRTGENQEAGCCPYEKGSVARTVAHFGGERIVFFLSF